MRNVVAYELVSLNGAAEEPDKFINDFDEVMRENLRRVIATQDTVLLGRRSFDEWAAFWPSSDIEPFATFINEVEKFVVTSTTPADMWANARVVDGDLVAFVADLKQQPGGDIGLHACIELTQALLELGLVDELRLVVAPTLHMTGRKLFDRGLSRRLTLTRQATSPSGHVLLDYQVGA